MKPKKIIVVIVLALSLIIDSAVAQSNWPRVAPTPEQLKEFFSQIESGRITKESLGNFLSNDKSTDYESARRILGSDFVTPNEVAAIRGISYTKDQLDHFVMTLPSEEALRWCKANGYAVVAGPPSLMGLLEVRSLNPDHFYSKTGGWYDGHAFGHGDKAKTEWLAIRKEPVPNSVNQNWNEQLRLLSKDEQVPNAGEMSWFITTFYEVRGVRLFEKVYVRTSSVTSDGDRVHVGSFDGDGLDVDDRWGGDLYGSLGVASARKLN